METFILGDTIPMLILLHVKEYIIVTQLARVGPHITIVNVGQVYYPPCGTYSRTVNNQDSCNTNCNWFITPFGTLGNSQPGTPIGQQYYSFVPLQVTTGLPSNPTDPVIQVACGEQHTMALTLTGKVFVWDDNSYGQLVIGSTGGSIQSPWQAGTNIPIIGILPNKIIAIVAGKYHSMALSALGVVCTWGSNSNGQLGDGTYTDNRFPRQVMGQFIKSILSKSVPETMLLMLFRVVVVIFLGEVIPMVCWVKTIRTLMRHHLL